MMISVMLVKWWVSLMINRMFVIVVYIFEGKVIGILVCN